MPLRLKEYLDFLVEELLDEKLRGGFDLNHFKKLPNSSEQKKYAQERLELLACGSERCSYILSSGKVLKLPTDPKFSYPEQNKTEVNVFQKFGSEVVPKVFDYAEDFSWLIVEPARVFSSGYDLKSRTGFSMSAMTWFERFLNLHGRLHNSDTATKWRAFIAGWHEESLPDWENLPPLGQQLIAKHHFLSDNGLIDITRADHWGWASDGRLVCVDPGISL